MDMNRMTISILLVVSILTFNSAFLCADPGPSDSSTPSEKKMDYKFIAPKTTIETGIIITKDGQNIFTRKISEDNNVIVYYLGHIVHGIAVDKVLSIANTSGSGLIGFSEGDRRDSLNGSGFQSEGDRRDSLNGSGFQAAPKTSITKVENLDDVNFIDGGKFFEKGNYTEAIQAYSLYLRYYPKSPTGYSNLGLCYLQKGNFKEALKYHTKAIELDDNRANLYIARSVSYWKMGLNDLAFADIEKAVELNPNNKDAYLKKGKFLFNKEEYKNAIKPFLKYLELGGNNWEALSALGWAYHKTDNDRDALKYLMIAHQSNEGSYDNNIRMADVYRGLKEYENAIKYYTLALNTDKKDIFLYLYRGISYMEKGDYSLAELDFKKALELKENDPVVLCNYAQLYIYQDKDRKAIPLLKKVLEVSKDEECNIWSKFTLEEISKSRKKTRNVIALFLIFIALIFLILLGVLKLKKSAGLMRVNVTKKLKYISTTAVLMCGVIFLVMVGMVTISVLMSPSESQMFWQKSNEKEVTNFLGYSIRPWRCSDEEGGTWDFTKDNSTNMTRTVAGCIMTSFENAGIIVPTTSYTFRSVPGEFPIYSDLRTWYNLSYEDKVTICIAASLQGTGVFSIIEVFDKNTRKLLGRWERHRGGALGHYQDY